MTFLFPTEKVTLFSIIKSPHSSVVSYVPTIIRPQVRIPSTPPFFNLYYWNCDEKMTKINKKDAGIGRFKKIISNVKYARGVVPFNNREDTPTTLCDDLVSKQVSVITRNFKMKTSHSPQKGIIIQIPTSRGKSKFRPCWASHQNEIKSSWNFIIRGGVYSVQNRCYQTEAPLLSLRLWVINKAFKSDRSSNGELNNYNEEKNAFKCILTKLSFNFLVHLPEYIQLTAKSKFYDSYLKVRSLPFIKVTKWTKYLLKI